MRVLLACTEKPGIGEVARYMGERGHRPVVTHDPRSAADQLGGVQFAVLPSDYRSLIAEAQNRKITVAVVAHSADEAAQLRDEFRNSKLPPVHVVLRPADQQLFARDLLSVLPPKVKRVVFAVDHDPGAANIPGLPTIVEQLAAVGHKITIAHDGRAVNEQVFGADLLVARGAAFQNEIAGAHKMGIPVFPRRQPAQSLMARLRQRGRALLPMAAQ